MSRRSLEDQALKKPASRGRKERKVENEADLDAATLQWKKDYAAFLKASDHSYRFMSDVLGVTARMVRGWFEKDENLRQHVLDLQKDMIDGALKLARRHGVEAIEILMTNARLAQKDRAWRDSSQAAEAVLDRIGLSKVSRSESHVTKQNEDRLALDEKAIDKLEALPLETQHKLAELAKEMQDELEGAKGKE